MRGAMKPSAEAHGNIQYITHIIIKKKTLYIWRYGNIYETNQYTYRAKNKSYPGTAWCARKGALINILSKYWACVLKPIINRPICAGNQQQRKKHVGKGISQVAIKPATE